MMHLLRSLPDPNLITFLFLLEHLKRYRWGWVGMGMVHPSLYWTCLACQPHQITLRACTVCPV